MHRLRPLPKEAEFWSKTSWHGLTTHSQYSIPKTTLHIKLYYGKRGYLVTVWWNLTRLHCSVSPGHPLSTEVSKHAEGGVTTTGVKPAKQTSHLWMIPFHFLACCYCLIVIILWFISQRCPIATYNSGFGTSEQHLLRSDYKYRISRVFMLIIILSRVWHMKKGISNIFMYWLCTVERQGWCLAK